MATVLKYYLRASNNQLSGTFPSAGNSIATQQPGAIASGGDTNRAATKAIGSNQTSIAATTAPNQNVQTILMGRWITEDLLAGKTYTFSGTPYTVHFGGSESNAASNFDGIFVLKTWNPVTGANDISISDFSSNAFSGNTTGSAEPGTSETALSTSSVNTTTRNITEGTVWIVELWRDVTVQSMSVSYTNTIFYDGTTEDSTSSNAAYLSITAGQDWAFLKQAFGQAQAVIKTTSTVYAQAQGRVAALRDNATFSSSATNPGASNAVAVQVGDLIYVSWISAGTASSVTDTASNSYITPVLATTGVGGKNIYYSYAIAATATSVTLTINQTAGTLFGYVGVYRTNRKYVFFASSTNTGTSTSPSTGSVAVPGISENDTLLIADIYNTNTGGSISSTTSGYKQNRDSTNGSTYQNNAYAHTTTNKNYSGTITSDTWAGLNVAFTAGVILTYGQALALISGDYTSVVDTFTRNISDGLGTADTGGDWTRIIGTAADADVNGSAATFVTTNSQAYGLRRVLHPTSIEVKAQFSLDALPSSGNLQFGFRTHRGTPDVINTGGLLQQISISSTGNLTGTVISSPTPPVAYTAGDTWNFKSHYYIIASSLKSVISIKLWKEGDTEPGWQVVNTNSGANSEDLGGGNFAVITVGTTGAPTLTLDNLVVSQTWLFQPAQAQAKIFAASSTQVYAQAQADIKQTYNAYAQSQADIKQIYQGYAQAQANIKQTSRVYGQAQADIKAISRAYAQAQADTKQSYTVYAQGQAHINQSHTVYGQAQAFIYIPQISVPISDISNDSWVRVVV